MNLFPQELLDRLEQDIGICSHSDEVTPNDVFVAIDKGVHYIREALDKGALAVVCYAGSDVPSELLALEDVFQVENIDHCVTALLAKAYANDLADIQLIGITGTNGKTSSAHFTCQLFKLLGVKVGYIGTLGYGVIDKGLYKIRNTTPDRISLHRYIAMLHRSGCKKIVMEVSSHAIVLGRLQGLAFEVGAFTNLSRDHLDFHLDMRSYAKAKLSFFSGYKINNIVVNADDTLGEKLVMQYSNANHTCLIGYGQKDSQLLNYLRYDTRGYVGDCVTVTYQGAEYQFCIHVSGLFNVENMLTAALICHVSGYSFSSIADMIGLVSPVPGRFECTNAQRGGARVCVDYAHTPAGMMAILGDASLLPDSFSEIWCVFGCGGGRDTGKRFEMGRAASTHADRIIVTDDNVRYDQAEAILCDIFSGIDDKSGVTICRDRSRAIRYAVQLAKTQDLVLVLGKGDESFVDYGQSRLECRDMDVVLQGSIY